MNIIRVQELRPGIAFTQDVYIDGDTLFVPAKVPIKAKEIERLLSWKIQAVQTEGEEYKEGPAQTQPAPRTPPGAEKPASPAPPQGTAQEVKPENPQEAPPSPYRFPYEGALVGLGILFMSMEKQRSLEAKAFQDILKGILPLVMNEPQEWLNFTLENPSEKGNYSKSAVNCMIFAVNIALKMEIEESEIEDLAMAALLHDAGMLRIPEDIRKKTGALSGAELEKIKTHTLFIYRYAISTLGFSENVGLTALLHHERWDGKGYPRQLAEEQIPILARILSVADSFEAMIRDTPYRDSLLAYTAMRQILNDNSRRFDANIIKVFIKSMGIYPVSSYVILNDGSIGIVSRINEEAPLRPEIRLLINKEGKKVHNLTLNLIEPEFKNFFIAKPFDPKEVKKSGK
ncbi:MAG: HD domain-containing protein [Spirochaetales bacterium]|jgi:HD-GYP domain-containing protein (c-di-GMP phosphodiesterase class II)|nr:HD domain-containing protein [Spirochaetales bacterium]